MRFLDSLRSLEMGENLVCQQPETHKIWAYFFIKFLNPLLITSKNDKDLLNLFESI